ncbi:MAG: hypothetical protein ACRC22_05440, partial [Shewanella sp.]
MQSSIYISHFIQLVICLNVQNDARASFCGIAAFLCLITLAVDGEDDKIGKWPLIELRLTL